VFDIPSMRAVMCRLWAWTNVNKEFIRYVVASAVCDTSSH
jgi:hypothetical protein